MGLLAWAGRLIGRGVAKPLSDYGQAREQTKQSRSTAWAITELAATAWRPALSIATGLVFVLYAIGTFGMITIMFAGGALGWEWATLRPNDSLDLTWDRWVAFGGEMFQFAALWLGIHGGTRGIAQAVGRATGQEQGARSGANTLLGERPGPPAGDAPADQVTRAPLEVQDGRIELMPGITVPGSTKRPDYFTAAEFECKGQRCHCTSRPMDARLMRVLNEDVRAMFGVTIVNSGYRCPIHNAEVGGAPNSYHTKGKAADVRVPGVEPREIYEHLDAKYPGKFGLGLYRSFVHVDVRPAPGARKASPDSPWRSLRPALDIELN